LYHPHIPFFFLTFLISSQNPTPPSIMNKNKINHTHSFVRFAHNKVERITTNKMSKPPIVGMRPWFFSWEGIPSSLIVANNLLLLRHLIIRGPITNDKINAVIPEKVARTVMYLNKLNAKILVCKG
jgi:hypothetical protein